MSDRAFIASMFLISAGFMAAGVTLIQARHQHLKDTGAIVLKEKR